MFITFLNSSVPSTGAEESTGIPIISQLVPMHIKELALIDDGWQFYDKHFSTIFDRKQYYFAHVGQNCYVKRRN